MAYFPFSRSCLWRFCSPLSFQLILPETNLFHFYVLQLLVQLYFEMFFHSLFTILYKTTSFFDTLRVKSYPIQSSSPPIACHHNNLIKCKHILFTNARSFCICNNNYINIIVINIFFYTIVIKSHIPHNNFFCWHQHKRRHH